MYLIKEIVNPNGFIQQIVTLQGSEEYLISKLDQMSDEEVVKFHISDVSRK